MDKSRSSRVSRVSQSLEVNALRSDLCIAATRDATGSSASAATALMSSSESCSGLKALTPLKLPQYSILHASQSLPIQFKPNHLEQVRSFPSFGCKRIVLVWLSALQLNDIMANEEHNTLSQ